ncbi:MAG: hypothetical protein IJX76_07265 [Clostridia bacterium]|nr:hypothetical protein [Clostridia bacterium]
MKKLFKPLTLALAALLMAGSLISCGDDASGDSNKTLTPEDVYEKVENAEDAKIVMEMEITDFMTTTMTAEKDGDKAYIKMDMEMMGMSQSSEAYTEKKGDTIITYTKNGDSWDVEESPADDAEDETSLDAFQELFNSDNFGEFDKKTGRYEMKDDVTIEADGMTLTEAYIEIDGDTFEIYAKIEMEESGMSMSGFLKIKAELTDMSVTIPEV